MRLVTQRTLRTRIFVTLSLLIGLIAPSLNVTAADLHPVGASVHWSRGSIYSNSGGILLSPVDMEE
jgi:hypothetical protein